MKEYTDDELLTLRLKYKENHEVLELIDTIEELMEDLEMEIYIDETTENL